MRGRVLTVLAAAATLMSGLAPGVASAQFAGRQFGYGGPPDYRHARNYNPDYGVQPNGCVRWCPRDDNPCDPPQFKVADGRCSDD